MEGLKKSRELTENHLIENNFFDVFTLTLIEGNFSDTLSGQDDPVPFDRYFNLFEEYLLTIKDVGVYFDYEVIVNDFFGFTFKKK